MFAKIVLSLLFWSIAFAAANSYKGFKIYDINATNVHQKEILYRLSENPGYDFFILTRILGESARVMVEPKDQFEFETTLNNVGLEMTIIDENVGQTVELERAKNNFTRARTASSNNMFNKYLRYNEINAYLSRLAKSYPGRVKVKSIGKSYKRRNINAIIVSNGDRKTNKKVILLDAGIHAREWISPASALYVIYQLVENYNANSHLLKNFDWIIIPLLNPDGYEYSHAEERLWRKTLKPSGDKCFGTDGNRNFDFHWGESTKFSDPCSDIFIGKEAFSEPEVKALRDLMHSLIGRAKFYLTLHSFGNMLLYPYGYISKLVPCSYKDLDDVAQAGADAIRFATNTKYRVGQSSKILYASAGASHDYAYDIARIPISIVMELPRGGKYGFDPLPNEIEPLANEAWTGIKAMAKRVISKY